MDQGCRHEPPEKPGWSSSGTSMAAAGTPMAVIATGRSSAAYWSSMEEKAMRSRVARPGAGTPICTRRARVSNWMPAWASISA